MNVPDGRITIQLCFIWVPHVAGGRRFPPWLGMRPMIRWQQPDEERDRIAHGVECLTLDYDGSTHIGAGTFGFFPGIQIDAKWLEPGQRIELLEGYRVSAVGITTARAESMNRRNEGPIPVGAE